MKQLSRTRAIMLLSFLVIVWGINWPLSKLALTYTPPILFAGIRTILGGLILLIFVLSQIQAIKI